MAHEAVSSLNLKPGYTVIDATVGGGGHSLDIIRKIEPGGRLIGVDADPAALKNSEETLKDFKRSLILVHDNFRNLDKVVGATGIEKIDAALFDIGVSSFQLDCADRGFSLKLDAALDMRMDPSAGMSAADLINTIREKDLADIIWKFGEERYSRKIARFIIEARGRKRIETTGELADIVRRAAGARYRKQRIDPATRTFQAIRIAVNDELGALEEGIKKAVGMLNKGGRIAVIAFHSLEDRIVKNLFRLYAKEGMVRIITKKPLRPSNSEVAANPRSRSARLRVAEKA
ncbi:MAG: 16S rRNA (cytosine(1402)-N(4))-methyltransferase RsmH [Candidatus Omnitrophica bacterium]|nr:16S rRNA (cytosine(1402)-N(4))-methyltransferase RsmH [Candidatus Omnitrophota bacterium]